MTDRVLHTDAPLMPLTQMIGGTASIVQGEAAGGRKDCMSGWGEAMADPITCTPHHMVVAHDEGVLMDIAQTLAAIGYQTVVSDFTVWSEDQIVLKYDNTHQH